MAGPTVDVPLTGVTGVAPATPPAGGIIAIDAPPLAPAPAAAGVVNAAGFDAAAAAAWAGACAPAAPAATFCATWLPTLAAAPRPFAAPLTAPEAIRADVSAIPDPRLANPDVWPAPLAAAAGVAPTPGADAFGAASGLPCAAAGFAAGLPKLPKPLPIPDDSGDPDAGDDPLPEEIGLSM
ncbi:hypothetical protein [Mycobacterium xenopi]|uniref:hypothetical protein n=1 Tax=Mycobacterium xenopi TaxID=1789 RepID=UPI001FD17DCC|nr:hypothetical protein [Mycobacterium xenopi]